MENSTLCNLETLPDELLLYILSFVSYIDVYRGFAHLNTRFSAILNNVHPSIRIAFNETKEEMDAIARFASQTYYLSTMGKTRDLTSFINLRSFLDYDCISEHVSFVALTRLSHLERLHLNCSCPSVVRKIFSLESDQQFPKLSWCHIPLSSFTDLTSLGPCSTLRSLELDGYFSPGTLSKILALVPQLNYLKMQVFTEASNASIPVFTICPTLTCLFVKIRCLENDSYLHDDYVLWPLFPNVKRVMLQVHFMEWVNFDRLHQRITVSWPYINHFDYKITFIQRNTNRFDIEQLRTSLPLFNKAKIIKDYCLFTVYKYKTPVEWQKDNA